EKAPPRKSALPTISFVVTTVATAASEIMAETIQTPLTKLFGIQHPIILAGMNATSGPELVAAVTNAGGLGVFGGLGYTPEMMKESIAEIKRNLTRKGAPFGVDLALPQVGGSARKTNYD
ncbi:hypothetical protein HK405_015653, partial [Cladochytrium tenue]